MVHIGYFIDDICLPPADLTAFHFMASLSLILHLLYHQMQGGGALKRILPPVFYSVDWDTKYIATLWSFSYNNILSK